MSSYLTPNTIVTPAKAGAWLFFSDLSFGGDRGEGSQAPDQVRGDEVLMGSVVA
jgi:hypothetical protein